MPHQHDGRVLTAGHALLLLLSGPLNEWSVRRRERHPANCQATHKRADTISIAASDSLGKRATAATIDVTAIELPVIAAPTGATLSVGQLTSISGAGLSESGNPAAPETLTATLSDSNGLLTVTQSRPPSCLSRQLFCSVAGQGSF
jgi:hypothetical protein